jgi:hypothetical protein
MPGHPHVHSPSYAPPVLRPPSPASSIGTSYAPDVSETEDDLSQAAFEEKCKAQLRLDQEFARGRNPSEADDEGEAALRADGVERWDRLICDRDRDRQGWGWEPLLATPTGVERTADEDKHIHEKILSSLRYQVHLLEENELFEKTLLQGSQAALESQPTSNDIDTLMRSMMGLTPNSSTPDAMTRKNNDNTLSVETGYTTANTTATAGIITRGPWNRGLGMGVGTEGIDMGTTPRRNLAKGKGRSLR